MNLPPIVEKWTELKSRSIKQYPSNNLRASSVGNDCERFLYHSIKDWKERVLHDVTLQSIFDVGNAFEQIAITELREMGFQIVEMQRAYQIDKPLITGSIDGKIRWENQDYPFDIKSISPYEYDKINSAEDMLFSKKPYQRQYPGQLQCYLYMSGDPVGCFILKNKLTGGILIH